MKFFVLSLLVLCLAANVVQGAIYAVLIAGSPGSGSGCSTNMFGVFIMARLYSILIRNGVPADNIIVFMNGGAINNTNCNPNPGHLYMEDDVDYLLGLRIDYNIPEMNTDNLFAVYQGNASAIKGGSGRVLQSGPNDTVLIVHASHGSYGWLQFGDSGIKHKILNQQLELMKQNGKFKGLLYMVDACYSGAVFDDSLVSKTGVYAMTACGPAQTTYGWLTKINGTYYSFDSVFTNTLFRHFDKVKLDTETVFDEYSALHKEHSAFCQYGNMAVSSLPANLFQGINNVSQSNVLQAKKLPSGEIFPQSPIAPYIVYKNELKVNPKMANDKKFMRELNNMEEERIHIRKMMKEMVKIITRNKFNTFELESFMNKEPERVIEADCHQVTLDAAFEKCPNVFKTPFVDDLIRPITNLCNSKYNQNDILEAINKLCNF